MSNQKGEIKTINTSWLRKKCVSILELCTVAVVRITRLYNNEQGHSISCQIANAPREESDQHAHLENLIRVLAGHSVAKDSKLLQADRQADLSLCWSHMQSCRKCLPWLKSDFY